MPKYAIVSYHQESKSVAIIFEGMAFTAQCDTAERYDKVLKDASRIAFATNAVAEATDEDIKNGKAEQMAYLMGCEKGINDASLQDWLDIQNPDAKRLELLNNIRIKL